MAKNLLRVLAILIPAMLLISSMGFATAAIQPYGHPRFDDAYLITVLTPSAQRAAFEACDVEMLPDMLTWTDIQALVAENQIMLATPGYHYCYIAMNCRDYVPDDAAQPDPGRPLDPMNWTCFRQALAWAGLNLAQKAAAINDIYGGPAVTAVSNPVPPALGYWSVPGLDPGGNYTKAWEILEACGFYVSGGLLYTPSGYVVRDQIEVLSPSSAPTSVDFTQEWVDQWNDFFDNFVGVTNCNFWNNPIETGLLSDRAFIYRNFDLYFLCWGLGRFPDYLYDFFHSSMEGVDNYNTPGIMDPALDAQLEIVKFGTVLEDKIDAAWLAQEMLVLDLVPCVYLYSRTYYNAFKNYTYFDPLNPNYLVNMINMPGEGADNGWTWSLMHWNTMATGGTLKYCNTGEVYELHPGWAEWVYEWNIVNRLLDGLLTLNPETVEDLPWIACDWSSEPWTWPAGGVTAGQKIRFQIRSDVLWHDLVPVTIEDVKFSLDFVKNFPRYEGMWQYLIQSQIVDPCTIDIYINTTSQWILYDLAGAALLFPKHIYGPNGWLVTHGYDPINAEVWEIDYNVGEAKKALVGCGPYVFDYFDPSIGVAHIIKFQHYWVDSPLKQNFIHPQRVDPDTAVDFWVEVVNTGSKDDVTGELVPAVIDYIEITLDGEILFTIPGFALLPFEYYVIGAFATDVLPCGYYYLDCHTYAYGMIYDEYESPIYVTIREDLNLDFTVNFLDAIILGATFGKRFGEPGYDERGDINKDNVVNFLDAILLGAKFGWLCLSP